MSSQKTLEYIESEAERIASEWNGDEPGKLEERADLAESILETVKLLRKEMEELGI